MSWAELLGCHPEAFNRRDYLFFWETSQSHYVLRWPQRPRVWDCCWQFSGSGSESPSPPAKQEKEPRQGFDNKHSEIILNRNHVKTKLPWHRLHPNRCPSVLDFPAASLSSLGPRPDSAQYQGWKLNWSWGRLTARAKTIKNDQKCTLEPLIKALESPSCPPRQKGFRTSPGAPRNGSWRDPLPAPAQGLWVTGLLISSAPWHFSCARPHQKDWLWSTAQVLKTGQLLCPRSWNVVVVHPQCQGQHVYKWERKHAVQTCSKRANGSTLMRKFTTRACVAKNLEGLHSLQVTAYDRQHALATVAAPFIVLSAFHWLSPNDISWFKQSSGCEIPWRDDPLMPTRHKSTVYIICFGNLHLESSSFTVILYFSLQFAHLKTHQNRSANSKLSVRGSLPWRPSHCPSVLPRHPLLLCDQPVDYWRFAVWNRTSDGLGWSFTCTKDFAFESFLRRVRYTVNDMRMPKRLPSEHH